ncbi:hypothetical protein [Streptomyces sp. NPDC096934]|uniref:hypothetical protein n=1 Tax=Streptomyces sp. NPDC096934 TaxID=3155551 RepID=UPI0033293688
MRLLRPRAVRHRDGHGIDADEHGRGLFLVTRLSRRWGTRHIPDGKIIRVGRCLPAGA